jgi:hypothetical protein
MRTLRLCSGTFLHTTSETAKTTQTTLQTPSPWCWSCSTLQHCGFDEPTPLEGQAASRIPFLRLLLNNLAIINQFKQLLRYFYQPVCILNLGLHASNNGGKNGIHCHWRQPMI